MVEYFVDGRPRLAGAPLLYPELSITVQRTPTRALGPLIGSVDPVQGDGEWFTRKHSMQHRQYRTVHLLIDTATSDIRALEFISRDKDDRPVKAGILNLQIYNSVNFQI